MGLQDLCDFVEGHCVDACRPVDLVEIGRGVARGADRRRGGRFCLAVDAETSLNRLYGGYYPDWVSGGQWNRMLTFLSNLMNACRTANMDILVVINGAMEKDRIQQWQEQQAEVQKNINHVYRHLSHKATPPPKVWWVAPACLMTTLRVALRYMNVPMLVTFEDHHQEVIACVRENGLSGLVADHPDYAIFDPPRYFSSHCLKLTYRGTLETKEYMMDDVAKTVDLHPQRFCVLAALLGTHILGVNELQEFYCRLCCRSVPAEMSKVPAVEVLRAVLTYVRGIDSIDDLDAVGKDVFNNCMGNAAEKMSRFKQAVEYYMNGTKEHFNKFLRHKPRGKKAESKTLQPGSYSAGAQKPKTPVKAPAKEASESPPRSTDDSLDSDMHAEEKDGFAPDEVYTEAESGYSEGTFHEPAADVLSTSEDADDDLIRCIMEEMASVAIKYNDEKPQEELKPESPPKEELKKATKKDQKKAKKERSTAVPQAVLNVTYDRHSRGFMHPWIYQLLSQGEIKLPVSLEDGSHGLPSGIDLFRPLRQHVYAILFDLSKQLAEHKRRCKTDDSRRGQEKQPKVSVREWTVQRGCGVVCNTVHAEPVEWLVPGIHRLWMGAGADDKRRRLRAFLSCMHCDVANNLLLNISFVPQSHIILCCVLRYMLFYRHERVMRRDELDAFLATACSPMLPQVEMTQELKLPMIHSRGVHLASLFMQGVDHALFVNDAVGAPIPWGGCCPWFFFDGKLLHLKLIKASRHVSLIELCDGRAEQVMQVERMRKAILQAAPRSPDQVFARPMLSLPPQSRHPPQYDFIPAGMSRGPPMYNPSSGARPRGRGVLGTTAPPSGRGANRGGQLQIAGVVVGNWGGSKGHEERRGRGRGVHMGPLVQEAWNAAQGDRDQSSRGARGRGRAAGGQGRWKSRGKGQRVRSAPQEPLRGIGRGCTMAKKVDQEPDADPPEEPSSFVDEMKVSAVFNGAAAASTLDLGDSAAAAATMLAANLIQNGFHSSQPN
ncbi:hypothetical protein CAPTEDRAFT_222688 [Capitella teleta]|uniref:Constitutive coactivator of PPAR-gamma-like protein 1 homolog n=1 Tax=Capitella teleta TaxID=283909 RepID=R7TXK4_CAPTE|nr:hypothetical protein CAPTEDRAFT_222688 [Capitella teleta]|eukprot:ELT95705.1 hypothetical protein CAPTEDRAFT_222688 [Capitella teleta]